MLNPETKPPGWQVRPVFVQDCVNAIGEALHGTPNGKGGFNLCDCPVHGGHNNLSVDLGNKPGTVALYCYSCGKEGTPAIIEAIKQMGLPWPGPASPSFALSPEQVEARQREQAEKKAQKARDQEAAAEEAIRLLKDASPDYQDHPYAKKKGKVFEDDVRRGAFPGIPDALLIPFKSSPLGPVQTVQAIGPAGKKRFLAGGQKKGSAACFSVFFWDTPCLCIAEGVATAGAVWQATGLPCIAAGDAGNMLEVAQKTHKLFKRAEIILLADEDPPGIEAAEKAARLVGGKIARPQAALDTEAPDHYDFWDLWHECGADAVKLALALDKEQDAKDKKRNPLTGR